MKDINMEEMKETIKKTEKQKTPKNRITTNEMIKGSDQLVLLKLRKLFNKIFKTCHYPNSQNKQFIFSIQKLGKNENVNTF